MLFCLIVSSSHATNGTHNGNTLFTAPSDLQAADWSNQEELERVCRASIATIPSTAGPYLEPNKLIEEKPMTLHTTGIDHVNLLVNDLDESIKFWSDLLGFDLLEAIPDQNGAIIGGKEAKLALYEDKSLGKLEKSGFSHLGFHIDDFDSALAYCQDKGITVLYDGVVTWPNSRSLYIQDPNGYEIELTDKWGGALV